ncbi:MAG TPA: transposase [Pirellulales bacterium]|nr:transposase [Pirellulales bacterium]
MMFNQVFERFASKSPVTVMVRGTLEFAFPPECLDRLFREHSVKQYEDDLLFSSVVDIVSLAVTGNRQSVHAAYLASKEQVQVSAAALYNKMRGVEPQVSQAVVRESVKRLRPLAVKMRGQAKPLLPGYRTLILDGSHWAATERRIKETRSLHGVPLPGQALVVLDPQVRMVVDVFPCEDAHAQERQLLGEVIPTLSPRDLIVADRNFCTTQFAFDIREKRAFFAIRQHASTLSKKRLRGQRVRVGESETGVIYEQRLETRRRCDGQDEVFIMRRITVELFKPTVDGTTRIHLITNLPDEIGALKVAELYLQRWTIENAFQELGQALASEINTLCYPKAALLTFCVAVATYNVLSATKTAIRIAHHKPELQTELSGYYMAEEVAATYGGMMIAIEPRAWTRWFAALTVDEMAAVMLELAAKVEPNRFRKRHRGPKKPQPQRKGGYPHKHVSTARLLAQRDTAMQA